jgi:septum formation topological specificity factor MinE
VEVPALQRDLLEIVDRHVELSRAGLRREVARLLRFRAPILGQDARAGL